MFPAINRVIWILVVGEFVLITSFGLIVPIFSLFIVGEITQGTAEVVGFALAIYWIVKSVFQLPIAKWLDRNHGERDDFWAMILGLSFSSIIAIAFFFFATKIWHIYFFEALWGLADAFVTPPFFAIFSRHLDKGREGFEWSLYSSFSFGAGSALGGALGGILASTIGLRWVFLFAGIGGLLGVLALFLLKPYLKSKVKPALPTIFIEQRRL